MTPEKLQKTHIVFLGRDAAHTKFTNECYPEGQKFSRLGLTLSKKGWTASVQWEGTTGARGCGKTIETAITDALETATTEWNAQIYSS